MTVPSRSLLHPLPAALVALLLTLSPIRPAVAAPTAQALRQAQRMLADDRSIPLQPVVVPGRRTTDTRAFTVTYTGADKLPIDGMLYVYSRASAWHPAPGIILIHGLAGPSDEMEQFGFFLAATGYAVLIIDESRRIAPDRTPEQLLKGIADTTVDIRRGVDFLRTQRHVNPRRIGAIGFGLGAVSVADAAAVDFRIRAAILVSTGAGLAGILQRSLAIPRPPAPALAASARAVDPALLAPYIAPRPILMINGKADTIVPPASAAALAAAARASGRGHVWVDWVPNAGHRIGLDRVYDYAARPWLLKHL